MPQEERNANNVASKYVTSDTSMNTETSDGGNLEDEELPMYPIRDQESPKPMIDVTINGKIIPIEVDTGEAVTIRNLDITVSRLTSLSVKYGSENLHGRKINCLRRVCGTQWAKEVTSSHCC